MAFTYAPLFATLHIRKKKITDFVGKLSSRTIAKLSKDEPVSLQTLDILCSDLNCNIEDVIKHIKN